MFRVADVLRPEVGRSWHEAVAIVQEVASQLVPGAAVPGADDLLLDDDGTLQLGFGSDTVQHPVTALGSLLGTLLDGIEAPVGLRELARTNMAAEPSNTTVESFQRALAFYERPSRDNDLRAVASRLRAAPPDVQAEFERLRQKVAAKDDTTRSPEQKRTRRISRRTMIVAAVVELAVLVALVAYVRPQYFRSVSAIGEGIEQRLADTISGGLNGGGTGGSAAAAAPAASVAGPAEAPDGTSPAAAGPAAAAAKTGTAVPRPRPQAPSPGRAAGRSMADTTGGLVAPVPAPIELLAAAGEPTIANPVPVFDARAAGSYSSADTDVEPPRLNRPQLPRQPGPGSDTGYFDLVVSETGEVEQVTLTSPTRRFQERMLVAAAKAWKFRPATRNGLPVRYRMRIAIILPAQP